MVSGWHWAHWPSEDGCFPVTPVAQKQITPPRQMSSVSDHGCVTFCRHKRHHFASRVAPSAFQFCISGWRVFLSQGYVSSPVCSVKPCNICEGTSPCLFCLLLIGISKKEPPPHFFFLCERSFSWRVGLQLGYNWQNFERDVEEWNPEDVFLQVCWARKRIN